MLEKLEMTRNSFLAAAITVQIRLLSVDDAFG